MGLSPKEQERLLNRPSDAHERATNDVRVRKKLAAWLKDFDDMMLVFRYLPSDQLRKELSDFHVYRLSYFLTEAMQVLDFHRIVGEISKPEEWEVDESSKKEMPNLDFYLEYSYRAAKNEDIARTLFLMDVFERLNLFFGDKNPVVEAVQLEKFEIDPKLRSRLTEGERRGMERVKLAWKEAAKDALYYAKEQLKASYAAQLGHIVEAKRDMDETRTE